MSKFPDHIQYIIASKTEDLNQAIQREGLNGITISDVIETFMQVDPTAGKKLVDWLVLVWTQNSYPGFLWEDVRVGASSKVANTLQAFALNFKRLPVECRNIYNYPSIGDVWQAIEPVIPRSTKMEVSGAEVKRRLKAQILEESLVIYRSESLIVSIPLTENASCWWGKGTQWCTAALKDNMFKEYSKKSPLIVLTLPQGLGDGVACKFQLHLESGQFMDEHDRTISTNFIDENWSVFGPVIEFAAQHNPQFCRLIPLNRLREETFYMKSRLSSDWFSDWPGSLINSIKPEYLESFLSPRVIDLFIEKDKCSLIPPHLFTSEQITRALEINPYYINHFEIKVTSEQAKELVGVKGKGGVLMWLEPDVVTPEIIRIAADNGADIKNVYHEEWLDRDTIRYFLTKDGLNIRFLSEEQKQDEELIQLAIEQNGRALSYVDQQFWTEELVITAIKSNSEVFLTLRANPKFLTPKVMKLAEEYSLHAIKYLFQEFITESMAEKAIKENSNYFSCLPNRFRNERFALLAIESCDSTKNVNLNDIFKWVESREVVLAYVKKFPKNSLEAIPIIDEEICRLAIQGYPKNITSTYLNQIDRELYKELSIKAATADPTVIPWISDPDQDFFNKVLTENPGAADMISDQKLLEVGITPPAFELEWDKDLLEELKLFFEVNRINDISPSQKNGAALTR